MINTILTNCDYRQKSHACGSCTDCSFNGFCPRDCEKCLAYIHKTNQAPDGSPDRKYDCQHMADYYTCKYSYRYTSELMHALKRTVGLHSVNNLKVLSFGCGPCTDLFAIDQLNKDGILKFNSLEYCGIDYSEKIWKNVHNDIRKFAKDNLSIEFLYKNACEIIQTIQNWNWVPDLIVFQYIFSDMCKNTGKTETNNFIDVFAQYFNAKCRPDTYIVLNDINLSVNYGGGREFFDRLYSKLVNVIMKRGYFHNDTRHNTYEYGKDSDGEFPDNTNFFDIRPMFYYSPFNTCASAQMIIVKGAEE